MSDHTSNIVNDSQNCDWIKECGILCITCNRIYTKKINYDRHFGEKHPGQEIILTCAWCHKTIDNYKKFRNHCYRHVIVNRYKCDFCTKFFSQKNRLNKHIKLSHGTPVNCEICKKSFPTSSNLNKHIREVHIGTEYRCDDCGKILHSTSSLKIHKSTHIFGQNFICDFCGKRFTRKTNLKTHIKYHSSSDSLTCNICSKAFPNKTKLNDHFIKHSDARRYKCEICENHYKTENYLKHHLKQHTSQKSLSCTICEKKFFVMTKLKDHMNTHTGEKPYKCKFCSRGFTNYPNCLKHIRKSHKVDHNTGKFLDSDVSNKLMVQKSMNNLENNNDINVYITKPKDFTSELKIDYPSQNQPIYNESVTANSGKQTPLTFSLQACQNDNFEFIENNSGITTSLCSSNEVNIDHYDLKPNDSLMYNTDVSSNIVFNLSESKVVDNSFPVDLPNILSYDFDKPLKFLSYEEIHKELQLTELEHKKKNMMSSLFN